MTKGVSGFVSSEPRVRVRDGQQRRVRVEGLRNITVTVKDCATSRPGRSALQNVTFECVSVKSRKYKSGDNLALLGPSLMFHAFCARFATDANSDCATHEIRCASGSVCNGSVGNVTSSP